jgi:hypothetical protein
VPGKETKSEAFHFAYIPYLGAVTWILASKYFTAIREEMEETEAHEDKAFS